MSMDVAESIRVATEWVERYAARNPNFRGAHLMGGITSLPEASPFPAASDLDIGVVVEGVPKPGEDILDEFYGGVPIEAGLRSVELYRSPEVVLANPDLACNLVTDSILADPYGLLREVQHVVAAEYARRRWVIERCRDEKRRVLAALEGASRASTPTEFLFHITGIVLYLAGLIAVARLKPPTHRKCLVLLRELLREAGRSDLYDDVLASYGVDGLNACQVMAYLDRSASAFDLAVEVHRTPSPFDFKLRPHLRPYIVDGTRSMIDAGDYRESMISVLLCLYVATAVLRNDAPAEESSRYDEVWSNCFNDLEIAEPGAWPDRVRQATALKESMFALADEIVAGLSDDTAMTNG